MRSLQFGARLKKLKNISFTVLSLGCASGFVERPSVLRYARSLGRLMERPSVLRYARILGRFMERHSVQRFARILGKPQSLRCMPGFPGSHRARDICPDSLVKVLALISRMVQELCPDFLVNELVPSSRVGCCREVLVVRERSVNAVAF